MQADSALGQLQQREFSNICECVALPNPAQIHMRMQFAGLETLGPAMQYLAGELTIGTGMWLPFGTATRSPACAMRRPDAAGPGVALPGGRAGLKTLGPAVQYLTGIARIVQLDPQNANLTSLQA